MVGIKNRYSRRTYRTEASFISTTATAGPWAIKENQLSAPLSFSDARHLGNEVEYMLDTPMLQARNRRLFDLEIDNIPGGTNEAHRLAYSVTYDGISYGQENWVHLDEPRNYTERILARRLGYTRNNVGFRLRWITDSPVPSVTSG